MTFCPYCASPVAETDKSCGKCGLRLHPTGAAIRKIVALVGAITALLAALPISFFKFAYLLAWERCFPTLPDSMQIPISLSTCGVIYYPAGGGTLTHLAYAIFITLMGALFGIGAAEISLRRSRPGPIYKVSPIIILWGIIAGILSDLLFVLIFFYTESI